MIACGRAITGELPLLKESEKGTIKENDHDMQLLTTSTTKNMEKSRNISKQTHSRENITHCNIS